MNPSGNDQSRTENPSRWQLRGRDAHTLAGAYAMDAISAPDRARFERHLAGCEECTEEITSLREATARLGTAAAATPPAGLKDRVMAATAITRQQPPVAAQAPPPPAARAGREGLGSWLRSLAWPGRMVLAAGAAVAVVVLGAAVVLGVSNGNMRQQLDLAQSSGQQITAVLTARDAHMMTGPVTGGGTATVVMSRSLDSLVFTAGGLPALPASRGYELWLVGPTGDRPVGMLSMGSHGMTGPVVAFGLRRGDHLALTDEPAGGSSQPTTPMMLYMVL
jgi:anti-sigma-K factor RskA